MSSTYEIFNGAGNGCFATAAYNFVISKDDRKSSAALIALGWFSKSISLIPFYEYEDIRDKHPHPISGISYPALTGIVTANIIALFGKRPRAKAIGKYGSLIAAAYFEHIGANIVYETPSTFLCATRVCIPPRLTDGILCDYNFTQSIEEQLSHVVCIKSRCIHDDLYWKEYQGDHKLQMALLALFSPFFLHGIAYADLIKYRDTPLQNPDIEHSLQDRIKLVTKKALFLTPLLTHLLLLKFNEFYRADYLFGSQSLFINMPYCQKSS